MFVYEKKLQYPVRIKNCNPRLASVIISQYGGPDGELGASLRYLSQRYAMPYAELKGLLTDIGISVSKLLIWICCFKLCHFNSEKIPLSRGFIPHSNTKRHIIEVNINNAVIIYYSFPQSLFQCVIIIRVNIQQSIDSLCVSLQLYGIRTLSVVCTASLGQSACEFRDL